MPKRPRKKRPRDASQPGKMIVDISTGEVVDEEPQKGRPKNLAAVALGKLGGRKEGMARAAKLTKKRRAEIAQKAARARWKRKD